MTSTWAAFSLIGLEFSLSSFIPLGSNQRRKPLSSWDILITHNLTDHVSVFHYVHFISLLSSVTEQLMSPLSGTFLFASSGERTAYPKAWEIPMISHDKEKVPVPYS